MEKLRVEYECWKKAQFTVIKLNVFIKIQSCGVDVVVIGLVKVAVIEGGPVIS